MTPLERYVTRATQHVWGKKKLEIQAELRGSIEARAWKLECQGFAPPEALETALRELGSPHAINAELIKVHTMPNVLKNTALLGLFTAFAITTLNPSRAQIDVVTIPAIKITTSNSNMTGTVASSQWIFSEKHNLQFLSLASLKQNLENAGIAVEATESEKSAILSFVLPGSTKTLSITAPVNHLQQTTIAPQGHSPRPNPFVAGDHYVMFWSFFDQLRQHSELPIKIRGWRNPKLAIGTTEIQIGSSTAPAHPRNIYTNIAGQALLRNHPQVKGWISFSDTHKHAVRIQADPGTVFALITTSGNQIYQHIDVARVADDGVLYFDAPYKVLEFVKTPLEVVQDRVKIAQYGYGRAGRPAKAILMRISADFKTSFETPKNSRSTSSI
jgi:hypothetical protein